MEDRDFWANDNIQQRLQNESFATNFWYEKRRDEFRLTQEQQKKLKIDVVSNIEFISAYLAFHLQNPAAALAEKAFFVSHREDQEGLYETIFNAETRFDDLLASDIMNRFVEKAVTSDFRFDDLNPIFKKTTLALSKEILQKYLAETRPNDKGKIFNVTFHLIMITYKEKTFEQLEILKIVKYTVYKLVQQLKMGDYWELLEKIRTKPAFYEIVKDAIDKEPLDILKIQSIDLSKEATWTQLLD
jgi:hypothetical protein